MINDLTAINVYKLQTERFFIMEKILFYLTLLTAVLSCGKESLNDNPLPGELRWTVGAEHATDTILYSNAISDNSILTVTTFSLCPIYDLNILVQQGSGTVLDTVYQIDDDPYEFSLRPGEAFTIQSTMVENDKLIQCVWMGEAKLVYQEIE